MFEICVTSLTSNCVGGQRLAKLRHPVVPRVAAPEVVDPQEAALVEIEAQRLGVLIADERATHLRRHHERAVEELGIGEANQQMVRLAGGILADIRLRQLRQPDRQVDVGTRPVCVPVAAVPVERRLVHPAAEMKAPVEILCRGELRSEAAEPAPAELRRRETGAQADRGRESDRERPAPAARHGIQSIRDAVYIRALNMTSDYIHILVDYNYWARDRVLASAEQLSAEDLMLEYRHSDVLVFASIYEGFGLPIVEAQAMGIPVITSKIAPMSDTAGDAALFVDPYDEGDIRAALERLLCSPDLACRLSDRGRSNAERFDARTVAGQYADLYTRTLSRLQ